MKNPTNEYEFQKLNADFDKKLDRLSEDPATGSAAGPLAAFMARHGRLAPGERRVVLQGQHVARPSRLVVSVGGTRDAIEDVRVGGPVQPVLRGELDLPD